MNSGMIKTTVREIKGSLGRYIAILAIVMLGVGLFTGLKATTPAMIATENTYLDEQNFFDFRLLSTIGFTEDDVEELTGLEKIADAEGAVSVDVIGTFGDGNELVFKIHTVPETIDQVILTAGRMPESADECLLDSALYGEDMIGSQITVTDNNDEDTLEMFRERTLTAVGVVRSPYYINFERGTTSIGEGKITAFLYVPKETFDCDYLTEIYVLTNQKYSVYTDEYEDYIDGMQEEIEKKTASLVQERYGEIITKAQEKVDDAQAELDEKRADAEEKLKDAKQKILDGEQEILDSGQEIADGEQEIADGEQEIAGHEQELADSERKLADGEQEIRQKEQEITDAETQVSQYEREVADNGQKLAKGKAELEQAKTKLQKSETKLQKQEASLSGQEAKLTQTETELTKQEKAALSKETELDGQEAELNSQKEQLEQAYAMQYISQEEYQAGLGRLQAGLEKIQAGREELLAGQKQIQAGFKQVQAGFRQVQAGKKEIQKGKKQLAAARKEISNNEKELLAGEKELISGKEEVKKARAELEEGKRELAKAKVQLQNGRTELADGKKQLEQAKADVADAKRKLEEGKQELEEGRAELADAKEEYADAKADYEKETSDAQKKINDARAELADMEEPDSYVLTRNTNIGYACYESDSNIVAGIANVFPVFFFLVAALICMTTMNRMVEEQRTQIGVLKALGYGNAAIMWKYLFYAGSAAAVGAVIGCIGGTWLFPKVIWMGYSIMYSMGEIEYYFDIRMAVLSLVAALVCSMGAAYFSCRYELYSVPANLIRPKAPKSGKRIFLENVGFIWGRMKFLHKVSMRNIVRYKKRFFMMILGISGCTALLVTGFGIKDSVTNVADMQYDEVQIYDIGITFSEGLQKTDIDQMNGQIGNMLAQTACRYEESVELDFGGKTKPIYLEIPENEQEIHTFLKLQTSDGEEIPYPVKGEVVLTAKIAESMGIKAGDQVILWDNDRNSLTVTVTALCENFVYNYAYINKETYQEQFGTKPEYKSAYAAVQEGVDVHEAAAAISGRDNVLAVSITKDMRDRIAAMMKSMDYIVALIIVCAGSLAFIVLYNLTNINITERIREIATIKVLGFYARETADYVFRENLALTGMGAVVGLGLGKWLHWFVMDQVNIDMLSFKTMIAPVSYLWSFLFTLGFALLVNGLMYFKLEKINMAESLKSIE